MKKYLFFLLYFMSSLVFAQEAKIQLGKTEIALNETFQISALVENAKLTQCSQFPDIAGFTKRGRSSSSNTSIINGRISSSESIIQTYMPEKQGTFKLPAFSMTINGKTVQSAGGTIKVGAAQTINDPFDDFWGFSRREEPTEFLNLKADAFFAVNTNKKEVYVGEGLNLTIAFYIGEQNQAQFEFPNDIGKQIADVLRSVKPTNCWEENFGIEEVTPEIVTINGRKYRQYKLYEANFYPINEKPIVIPSVPFRMIEYKMTKTQSFWGPSHVKDTKQFNSQARNIRVKALPDHPLKGQVAVGNYRLREKLAERRLATGKSVNYQFMIEGEGNISAVQKPDLKPTRDFDIYEPNVAQNINRNQSAVYGTKVFNYQIIPNEPRNYKLGDYFYWIFFNPTTATYDTLRSDLRVTVEGESRKNTALENSDLAGFYEQIKETDNEIADKESGIFAKLSSQISLFIFAIISIFVAVVRKNVFTKKTK